jgi:hypothetical protein
MPQRSTEFKRKGGLIFHLAIRGEPTFKQPTDFAVVIYTNDPESGERVEVVRIDSSHGEVHIHRFYRQDNAKEPMELGLWDAVEFVSEKGETFIDRFLKSGP